MTKNTGLEENIKHNILSSIGNSLAKRTHEVKGEDREQILTEFEKIRDKSYEMLDRMRGRNKRLLDAIPSGDKHKKVREIAKLLLEKERVDNHLLAQRIRPTVRGNTKSSKKLSKRDYLDKQKQYNDKIEYRFKILKKLWKKHKYTVSLHKLYSELVPLK